jgi:hypothetical protein
MIPINPNFARTIADQRIQEHLDQAAAHRLVSKGSRLRLGALRPVRLEERKARPVRLWARNAGRAY